MMRLRGKALRGPGLDAAGADRVHVVGFCLQTGLRLVGTCGDLRAAVLG
ncbi:hypothetical protein [Symbiobacterium thermophilum]|nr:hypothetical protein [Symbiobacterium thermophilum]